VVFKRVEVVRKCRKMALEKLGARFRTVRGAVEK